MTYELATTEFFEDWFSTLKDKTTKRKIDVRLQRIVLGNFGDNKQLAENLWELRFTFGGGIRIYYTIQGETVVLLLNGGKKAKQSKDINFAKRLLEEL